MNGAERASRRFEAYYKKQHPEWTLGEVHVEKLAAIILEETGTQEREKTLEQVRAFMKSHMWDGALSIFNHHFEAFCALPPAPEEGGTK